MINIYNITENIRRPEDLTQEGMPGQGHIQMMVYPYFLYPRVAMIKIVLPETENIEYTFVTFILRHTLDSGKMYFQYHRENHLATPYHGDHSQHEREIFQRVSHMFRSSYMLGRGFTENNFMQMESRTTHLINEAIYEQLVRYNSISEQIMCRSTFGRPNEPDAHGRTRRDFGSPVVRNPEEVGQILYRDPPRPRETESPSSELDPLARMLDEQARELFGDES